MFTLPKLPYSYAALEPYIDAQTMEIHHSKHHQAYIDKLNAALAGHEDLLALEIDALLSKISELPGDLQTALTNHGGGHGNHSLFWQLLSPTGGEPTGELKVAMDQQFGDLGKFKTEFSTVAAGQFGSGWGWLVLEPDKSLKITSTSNQVSPLTGGQTPLLAVDVWEHAYYLKYQNRRADYLDAFWHVVNWAEVGRRYEQAAGR